MKMHCAKLWKARHHHGRRHFNEHPESGTWTPLECESEGSNSDSSCSPSFDKMGHHGHKMIHFGRKVGRRFGHSGGHHGHKMGHHGHKMGHHGHKMDHHGHKMGHHGHKMGPQEDNIGHHISEDSCDKANHRSGKKQNKMHYRRSDSRNQKNGIISSPDKFEIILCVKQFKSDEVSVKAVNNSIIVDCKHGERELKNEFISRHILRRFEIPAGYDLEIIQSELSADGILRITIPKIQNVAITVERVIPVIIEEAPINQDAQEEQQVINE